MSKRLQKIIEGINQLDGNEITSVVDAIKLRRNQLHFTDAQLFNVGDRVSFMGRHKMVLKGTVQKIKIKFILISADNGQRWNVPGSHLTKIKETVNA